MRDKQVSALRNMINTTSVQLSEGGDDTFSKWTILIYDQHGQDILSPLISVTELRDLGVSLHLPLNGNREAISDVRAVYFVLPTKENIDRFLKDCRENIYETFEINFLSAVPRELLEHLATASVDAGCVDKVTRVFDMYTNFISLEDNLFTVPQLLIPASVPVKGATPADTARTPAAPHGSYYLLSTENEQEFAAKEIYSNYIVQCLFSVIVTYGWAPIIRCSRGHGAEYVATKLVSKIRDHLKNANHLFSAPKTTGGSRPILILLDRELDLNVVMHHCWIYQALVHDILDSKLNRVTCKIAKDDSGAKQTKIYDLDKSDSFWMEQRGKAFPEVTGPEGMVAALDEYREKEKQIRSFPGVDGAGQDDSTGLADNTAKISSAVSSLPELLNQKRLLDQHTTVLSILLDAIKERKLDLYYNLEQQIMNNEKLSTSIRSVLEDPLAGSMEDKLRLYIICLLHDVELPKDDHDKCEEILRSSLANLECLPYIRKLKQKLQQRSAASATAQKSGQLFPKTVQNLFKDGQKILAGTFAKQRKDHVITRIVDSLVDSKASDTSGDDYLYFDPLSKNDAVPGRSSAKEPERKKESFKEAIVFMLGGGSYTEYHNLMDYAASTPDKKKIIYGVSELVNPTSFIAQLNKLA